MWSIVLKAGAWLLAHKSEIGAGISIWRRLRAKRLAGQKPEAGPVDYYTREALNVAHEAWSEAKDEVDGVRRG